MYTYFNISEHMIRLIRGTSRQYVYMCVLLLNNLQSLWLTVKGLCKGDPILRRDYPGIQIQQNKQYSYCGAVQNIHLFRCLVGSANLGHQHVGGQTPQGKEHVTYMCGFKNTIALKSLSNKMASNRNYAQWRAQQGLESGSAGFQATLRTVVCGPAERSFVGISYQ